MKGELPRWKLRMDLVVVRIDPRVLRRKQDLVRRIERLARSVELESGESVELCTAEYSIYHLLVDSGLPIKAVWHELRPETELALFREALSSASDLVHELGDGLAFKGVNLIDPLLFEFTVFTCRTILWIRYAARAREETLGLMILLTSLAIPANEGTSSELSVRKVVSVSSRGDTIRSLLGQGLRLYRRTAARFGIANWPAIQVPSEGKKKLLIIGIDSRRHYDTAEPLGWVMEELKRHEDLQPLVAVENSITEEYLKKKNFGCYTYSFCWTSEAERHLSISVRKLRKKCSALIDRYNGTMKLMALAFLDKYANKATLAQIYSRVLWLGRVFDQFQPDAVAITFTYAFLGKIASKLASIGGIPSLGVYWGAGYSTAYDFELFDDTDFIGGPCERFRQALAAVGVDLGRYISIGNPIYEAIATRDIARDREFVSRLYGILPQQKVFLVTGHLIHPGTSEWVRGLCRQLRNLDPTGYKLIIKPHPDESSDEYERIIKEEESLAAVISTGVPLYSLLGASDLVFNSMSQTAVEAALFDKPIICINLTNIPYLIRYDEEGVAYLVTKEEEILPAIRKVLGDDRVKHDLELARKRFQRLYVEFGSGPGELFVSAVREVLSRSTSVSDKISTK